MNSRRLLRSPWPSDVSTVDGVEDKEVVIIADGLHGPTALYSDGTVEHLDLDKDQPLPLLGDVNFEEVEGGFEVWISERLVVHHSATIDEFTDWLRERPEVASVDDDTLGVVQARGTLDEVLRDDIVAWWKAVDPEQAHT